MRKSILILLACFAVAIAQAQPFQKGTTTANMGIGLGTTLGGLGKARPAVSASVDHGIWSIGGPGVISLGGYVGNTGYKYRYSGYTAKWNYTVIGARGAYHYNGFEKVPDLDVYGGVMLGYNIMKYSSDDSEEHFSGNYDDGLGFSCFVGGRWFFSDSFGVYGELGYGVSVLNVGVTFKF